MTVAPHVELTFNPTDLRPKDIPWTGRFLGSPSDAIQAGLWTLRGQMITHMKTEVRAIANPTYSQLLAIADLAWKLYMPSFGRVTAPVMADAYIRAYRRADAGDVPISVIYDLAEKHAEKTGTYFHESSRDALADGFNTMVNRRLPAKAAADKVLDAYGLTPRQMNGYVNNKQLMTPVDSPSPFDVKLRAREYIDRSFTQRVKKMSEQEEHNIEEQAKQLSWMWMQDKGRLTDRAQKIWITASDERVCPVCGPLHGQKVLVKERFKTDQGLFWSPGVHPNCRCVVRLIENRFRFEEEEPTEEDLEKRFDPHQPRGNNGRWSGGQSSGRKLGTKLNRMETPSAKVVENVARHRAAIAVNYVKEPRYLTTPIKNRDREMWKLAHGAAAWSRRSENVLKARKMEDPDNEYYANKLKLTRTEKSLKSLITAVQSAPQNSPELYRGVTASSPWKTQSIMPGMIMDLPLSSFTEDKAFSELFARKWGPKIEAARAKRKGYEIGDDAVPMVFVLEPKAQALNISPLVSERQAEWVTRGKFQITSTGVDDNGMGVVHIKQLATVSKADIWEPEDHPRGGDPENSGRFSRRIRPIPRLAPMAEPVDEEEPEPEVVPESRPETKQETKEQWGSPGGWGSPASSQGWGSNAPAEQQGWGSPVPEPTPEPKQSQGWGSPAAAPEAKQSQGWGSPAAKPETEQEQKQAQGAARPALKPAPAAPKPKEPEGPHQQISPSGEPYYMIVEGSHNDVLYDQLLVDEEFTTSRQEIQRDLVVRREQKIEELFHEVCGPAGNKSAVLRRYNAETGEHEQAWIDPQTYRQMLTDVAHQSAIHRNLDLGEVSEYNIPVTWNVGGHKTGEGLVSARDTVAAQGVHPEAFIWEVLSTTHGHTGQVRASGQHAMLSGAFIGYEKPPETMHDTDGKPVWIRELRPE